MERLLKELIQLEKKRNSMLASIDESLNVIASKETSTKELFKKIREESKQFEKNTSDNAFTDY